MSATASAAQVLQVVITEDPPARLDKALARDVPEEAQLSRTRLGKLIAEGAVRRAGEVLSSLKASVTAGDVIEITVGAPVDVDLVAEDIPLNIVYEDASLVVINKPTGMVVHPAPGSWTGTLVNALMYHCGDSLSGIGGAKRPGIVHRIDKETTGLLVVAKTDKAHAGLAAQFAAHTVEREYTAICYGVPDAADPRLAGQSIVRFEAGGVLRVTAPIGRHRGDRQKMDIIPGGRHAVTRARIEESFGVPPTLARVTCWLETGRTHQIRVHLAKIGHGLLGDPTYGGARKLSVKALSETARASAVAFPRQALHAATLGFVHPDTSENMRFAGVVPDDMASLVEALRVPGT
jgi:23S rRNA pseudouridine1911/1915/1917 synthase